MRERRKETDRHTETGRLQTERDKERAKQRQTNEQKE